MLQAAVNVDLALLGLGFSVAHLTGGVFGVLGHVLHTIGHFVDRSGHQLHLLRLLLAAFLGLGGVATQFIGRLSQCAGRILQLAYHMAQLAGKRVEVSRQLSDLILAVGVEGAGQVAFTAGNVGHGVHRFLQGPHDAAHDQGQQQAHDHYNRQANQRSLDQLGLELGLHVIYVHA